MGTILVSVATGLVGRADAASTGLAALGRPFLAAVMITCIVAGIYEAWNGHLGRCALFVVVGLCLAGYVILQAFVPGALK